MNGLPLLQPAAFNLPPGWKQEWSTQFRTPYDFLAFLLRDTIADTYHRYFVNIYTNESVWIKPETSAQQTPNHTRYTPPALPTGPNIPTMAMTSPPLQQGQMNQQFAVTGNRRRQQRQAQQKPVRYNGNHQGSQHSGPV
jgi:hypothetical protein